MNCTPCTPSVDTAKLEAIARQLKNTVRSTQARISLLKDLISIIDDWDFSKESFALRYQSCDKNRTYKIPCRYRISNKGGAEPVSILELDHGERTKLEVWYYPKTREIRTKLCLLPAEKSTYREALPGDIEYGSKAYKKILQMRILPLLEMTEQHLQTLQHFNTNLLEAVNLS